MNPRIPQIAAVALLLAAMSCFGGDANEGGGTPPSLGGHVTGAAFVSAVDAQPLDDDSVRLLVRGDLPTPCHEVKTSAGVDPARPTVIDLRVWSTSPSDRACEQILTPFTTRIDVRGLASGAYSVVVAGNQLATFEL